MTVSFDVVAPSSAGQGNSTATTATWSHTMSAASNGLLLVGVALGAGSDTGITTTATYNGVSMTSLSKRHSNDGTAGYLEVFYLKGPATGANTVLVTASTASDLACGSISFTGVDQTTPLGTPVVVVGSTANPSASLSAATGNYGVAFAAVGSGFASPTQTGAWILNANANSAAGNGAAQYASGDGSSKAYGWTATADWWAEIVVEVLASGGGGGASTPPRPPVVAPSAAVTRAAVW